MANLITPAGSTNGVQELENIRDRLVPPGEGARAGALGDVPPVRYDGGKSNSPSPAMATALSNHVKLSPPQRKASRKEAERAVKALVAALIQGLPAADGQIPDAPAPVGPAPSRFAMPPPSATAFFLSSPEAMSLAISNLFTQTLLANVSVDSKTFAELDKEACDAIKRQGTTLLNQMTEQQKAAHRGLITKIFSLVMDVVSFVLDAGTAVGELMAGDPQGLASLTCAALDLAQLGLQIAASVDPSKSAKLEKGMEAIGGLQAAAALIGMAVGTLVVRKAIGAATDVGVKAVEAGKTAIKLGVDATKDVGGTVATVALTTVEDTAGSTVEAATKELGSTLREEAGAAESALKNAATDADKPFADSAADMNERLFKERRLYAKTMPSSGLDSNEVEGLIEEMAEAAGNKAEEVTGRTAKAAGKAGAKEAGEFGARLTKTTGSAFEKNTVREIVGGIVTDLLSKAIEQSAKKWGSVEEDVEAVGKGVTSKLGSKALSARRLGVAGLTRLTGNITKSASAAVAGSIGIVQAKAENAVKLDGLDVQRQKNSLELSKTIQQMLVEQMQNEIKYIQQTYESMSDIISSNANLVNTVAHNV
ncbi:type III secretion system translocon subunit SctE [Paraburkholderia sediminicola]|uniref:type III secretion system translocon subunit SctE n=1 Tax=Paraburkholderia sediminicola TaxID=458836 RepID=UPI0038BC850A